MPHTASPSELLRYRIDRGPLVLAVAGGGIAALGAVETLDAGLGHSGPVSTLTAVLGATTAAGSLLAGALWRMEARPVTLPTRPSPTPAPVAAPCPTCEARIHHARLWDTFGGFPARHPTPAPAAAAPSPAAAAASFLSGDLLWTSWEPAVSDLPVPVVGPVAESAYSEPSRAPPDPYADRTPALFVDLRTGELLTPLGALPPEGFLGGTPDDLEPMGDALPARSTVRPDDGPAVRRHGVAPARSGAIPTMLPDLDDGASFAAARSGGFAGPGMDRVRYEALEFTPPHLRPTFATSAPAPPEARMPLVPSAVAAAFDSSRCASCADPIDAPAAWRRCRRCARPLCHECLVTSLVDRQLAACAGCLELYETTDGEAAGFAG